MEYVVRSLAMRALARPKRECFSRSVSFCTRNDVMRLTQLNQFLGMLAVTATMCGIEAAIAQHAAAPPRY